MQPTVHTRCTLGAHTHGPPWVPGGSAHGCTPSAHPTHTRCTLGAHTHGPPWVPALLLHRAPSLRPLLVLAGSLTIPDRRGVDFRRGLSPRLHTQRTLSAHSVHTRCTRPRTAVGASFAASQGGSLRSLLVLAGSLTIRVQLPRGDSPGAHTIVSHTTRHTFWHHVVTGHCSAQYGSARPLYRQLCPACSVRPV